MLLNTFYDVLLVSLGSDLKELYHLGQQRLCVNTWVVKKEILLNNVPAWIFKMLLSSVDIEREGCIIYQAFGERLICKFSRF